ncbi:MAG: hypothetical protein ACK4MF_08795 [Hyphomicrobiaceae bacterium]
MRDDLLSRGTTVRHLPPRSDKALSAAILKSFNTWAYKREQPSDTDLLLELIERRVEERRPVSFVSYWGKGPRAHLAAPDRDCLDYLLSMARRIESVWPEGASFTLLTTDTHAQLNGHSEAAIDSYFAGVDAAARARGMQTIRLSRVVESYESGVAPLLPGVGSGCGDNDNDNDVVDDQTAIIHDLARCAAKWYRGDGTPEAGARRYFAMNMIERRAVEEMFPSSVFATFNGSSYRDLFPLRLPIFYMYSLKRGTSVKPWFMDGDGTPFRNVEASFG